MASHFRYVRFLAVIVFALTSLGAFAQPSDEAIWKNFMEWFSANVLRPGLKIPKRRAIGLIR